MIVERGSASHLSVPTIHMAPHVFLCFPKTKQNRKRTHTQIKQIRNHQNLSDSRFPKLQTGNGLARKKERKRQKIKKGQKKTKAVRSRGEERRERYGVGYGARWGSQTLPTASSPDNASPVSVSLTAAINFCG